ncbi:MAG: Secretion system C-terminal sorting domain, partial [Bacteroidota bacterium]
CAFSNNIAGLEESFGANQIFPNPANKTLQIQGSDELQTYFQLLDVRGAVVLTGFINKSQNTIDIENIKNGTYLLQLESVPTSFFKVIIAH